MLEFYSKNDSLIIGVLMTKVMGIMIAEPCKD